jgi:hypothetical protein
MASINLLPKETKSKEQVVGFASVIRKLTIYGFILFFIFAANLIGLFFYDRNRVNNAIERVEDLKNEVIALERVEQRIVLLKDRISKANLVLDQEEPRTWVEEIKALQSVYPEGTLIKRVEINRDSAVFEMKLESSSVLVEVLSLTVSSGYFDRVNLLSLGYNPEIGYQVSIEAI